MRPFTAAAIQLAPHPGPLTAASGAASTERAVAMVRDCVSALAAELGVYLGPA